MAPFEYDMFFDLCRLGGRRVELCVDMDGQMDGNGRPGRMMTVMRVTDAEKTEVASEVLCGIHDLGRVATVLAERLAA